MFLEQALTQTVDITRQMKILDLSAAPGGKSTHIQSLITPDSLLVSNDVIRSRAVILKENIIKWGCENVVVCNNDPKELARLENYFDVIVVDAPCSGSGLFRREADAIDEWSENNVSLCSRRQQRILADILPALKNGGVLIYSTCSYSKEEDEDILDWMVKELRLESIRLRIEHDWGLVESECQLGYGYRFWPYRVKGEGFFITCLRKKGEEEEEDRPTPKNKTGAISKKEEQVIENWMNPRGHRFIRHENTIYSWPEVLADGMSLILSQLRLIYSGVRIGELLRDKMIPDHALAMSKIVNEKTEKIEVNYEQAIQYLQRKDLKIDGLNKGWQLVNYQGHTLGWINALPNRINNYYPKELRILKS